MTPRRLRAARPSAGNADTHPGRPHAGRRPPAGRRPLGLATAVVLALAGTVVPVGAAAGSADGSPASTAAAPTKEIPAVSAPLGESRNTSFVERDGTRLVLDGETFRFSGTNIYWLGLDENVPPGVVDHPTFFRIRDALDTASNLGVTVVRSHMLASTGTPLAILPSKEAGYDADAFASIDYAVAYAASKGIRLILPLTDEWAYYHGGHRDFGAPYGLCAPTTPLTPCAEFYSDPRVVADFTDYVYHVMDHVNPYTGLALKDDPTVLAWELGNELEGMTPQWIEHVATEISERAPRQLVAAGKRFGIDDDTLASPLVDIVDVHYYPPTASGVRADAARVTDAGKVYIAGEYASTAATPELLEPLAAEPDVTGMMFWSLFGHDDASGLVPHDDGFTLHYPGTDDRMRGNVAAIRDFSVALAGAPVAVEVQQPLVTAVGSTSGFHEVSWRGAAGAATYRIERAAVSDGVPSGAFEVVAAGLTDTGEPHLDTSAGGDAAYRVVPVGADGADGPASEPVVVAAGERVLVDPLETQRPLVDHAGLRVTPDGDAALLGPAADGAAHATWTHDGLTGAELRVRSTNPADVAALAVETSADGETWAPASTAVGPDGDGRFRVAVSAAQGERLRVTWPAGASARLERVTLRGAADLPVVDDALDDLTRASAEGSVGVDTGNPDLFGGDAGRAKRDAPGAAALAWEREGLTRLEATGWYWPDAEPAHLAFEARVDGAWQGLDVAVVGAPGTVGGAWGRFAYTASLPAGADAVRVVWPTDVAPEWAQQLGHVRLFGSGGELAAPGAFAALAPDDGALALRGTPTLRWEPAGQAATYRVTLARTDAPGTPIVSAEVRGTSLAPAVELEPATSYAWHVEAVNGAGSTGMTGGPRTFATDALPTEPIVVEDYEGFADDAALTAAHRANSGGDPITSTLVPGADGGQAMRLATTLASSGYAGVTRTFDAPQSWWGYEGLDLWLDRSGLGAGQSVTVQVVAGGQFWETVLPEVGPRPAGVVHVPFADLALPPWAGGGGRPDLQSVTEISFYLGGGGTAVLVVDDVRTAVAGPGVPVTVEASSRCLAGKAYVAVRATNDGDAPVAVSLGTPYESKAFATVAPGANAYQSFAVRATSVAAGSAVVTVGSGGEAVEVDAPYAALACG
ncbi:cellulase family glycosylhydrolase [Cellulosimicrobium sp. 22601]|uniref:cellulase family glycosylhydrolase n=1 Tax=unclassified Cellulosimicrobium TaxID=2624466 RepID=UPI003F86D128